MARNERPESGPPGSDRNEHALNMVTLYRSRLEQARANLHLAPTHAERRLHLLRSAHEFTSTPSDLVNIAGAIRAYESGLITSTETQQVIFFNGRIIDRIPPGAPLDYTERMEQYTNLDPTGSIWVEPPSTTPRPLACSAITLENSTDTMNSIHVEANITEGSHWYMDQTLQLCWPGGKPFFTSSKTKYPSTRPPHPDLELPFNRKQVSGPVTFSFLVDSGATDILIFEEDLSSMGFKQGVTPMMSMTSVLTATATVKMPRYACFVSYPGTDMVRESSFFVIKRAQKDSSRLSGLGVWRDFSTFTAPLATKKGNTTVFYGEDSTHGMIATMNRAFGKKGHMLVKPQEKERVTAPPPKPLGKKKVEEKKEMKKEGNSIARWIFEKKALRKAGPKLPPKGTNMEDDVFSFDETRVQRTTDYVPINKGRKLLQSTKYSTPLRKILAAGAVEARTRGGLRRKGEGRPNKVVKKAAKKASKKAETEKAGRFPFYDDVVGKDGTIL
ncbi:hypothetical protein BJ508DRAFT_413429 [Ascobolus immersus RN42]|uniref:Uncharacterized protein n=1 Tax=Ascobolus immersus RN42 TaxID=1160509 RepID=A0A3N4IFL8_ASCIM|nr:hypothetical protein BJ508DRAFT_413429 [Ascobolus immersus RN42]